jgi:hypothetical protein
MRYMLITANVASIFIRESSGIKQWVAQLTNSIRKQIAVIRSTNTSHTVPSTDLAVDFLVFHFQELGNSMMK